MPAYGGLIVEVTGCLPSDTEEVEDLMRTQSPTLDGLSRKRFADLARAAWDVVQITRRIEAKST